MSSLSHALPFARGRSRELRLRSIKTTKTPTTKRWKISMSELCALASVSCDELRRWTKLGLLDGKQIRSTYVDLDTARAVLGVRKLIDDGLRLETAIDLVTAWQAAGESLLTANIDGVRVRLHPEDLDLP